MVASLRPFAGQEGFGASQANSRYNHAVIKRAKILPMQPTKGNVKPVSYSGYVVVVPEIDRPSLLEDNPAR